MAAARWRKLRRCLSVLLMGQIQTATVASPCCLCEAPVLRYRRESRLAGAGIAAAVGWLAAAALVGCCGRGSRRFQGH